MSWLKVQAAKDYRIDPYLREACQADAEAHCKGTKPEKGQMQSCLVSIQQELHRNIVAHHAVKFYSTVAVLLGTQAGLKAVKRNMSAQADSNTTMMHSYMPLASIGAQSGCRLNYRSCGLATILLQYGPLWPRPQNWISSPATRGSITVGQSIHDIIPVS